jgi:hypothetical protein
VFFEYHRAYADSSQFPVSARRRIPPALVDCIDRGLADFFLPLKCDFPLFYASIMRRFHSFQLLEHLVDLPHTPKQRLYCWGAEDNGLYLRIGIPRNEPGTALYRRKFEPMLNRLPDEFRAFYLRMDGIGFLQSGEIYGRDLPLGFSYWRSFSSYLADRGVVAPPAIEHSADRDLRLFTETRRGHLVLSDDIAGEELYCVFAPNYDAVYKLEQTSATMDGYFASAVAGEDPDLADLLG